MEPYEVEKQLPVLLRELAGMEKHPVGIVTSWKLCEMDVSKDLDPMSSQLRKMGMSTLFKLDEARFLCFFDDEDQGRWAWKDVRGYV